MDWARSGLAVAIAVSVTLGPMRVTAAAPDAEQFVVQAEAALGEQKYAEAADLFERAYRSLSARERTSPLGEHLVLNAAEAHEQAWLASDDTSHLASASSLLRKHVAVAEVRKQPVSKEIQQTRERIDGLVDKLEEPPEEPPETEPEPPEPVPETTEPRQPAPRPEDPPAQRDRGRPDGLAIGLLAGGSVAVVGGATMIGVGAALPGWAESRLDERGGMGDQDQQFLDDADELSLALMVGGGVLAGVGVAALIWGSIRAVRGPRNVSRAQPVRHVRTVDTLQVAPVSGSRMRGLAISGRW